MSQEYSYFSHKKCEYFPCHKGADPENFNCLFCYCPMNPYEDCPGNPVYRETKNGRRIKVCTGCTFPHQAEHYDEIMDFLRKKLYE